METSDRIKEILRRERISGLKLCKLLGVSDNTFKSLTSGRTQSISSKLADGIVELFPHYNKLWLLTGDGEMLTQKKSDNDITIIATQQDATVELMRQELKLMRQELAMMRHQLAQMNKQNNGSTYPSGIASEPEPKT